MASAWPTLPAAPSLVRIPHPQCISSIPGVHPLSPVYILHPPSLVLIPHPKARGRRGTAPVLTGAPGTKGLEESANFSPQLDLIFPSAAPLSWRRDGCGEASQAGKSGMRAEGRAPARPRGGDRLILC